jgi:hypothetical protein
MQDVFADCAGTPHNMRTPSQTSNLQEVSLALVHWKMASQGGRADRARNNALAQWNANTVQQLLNAYGYHVVNPQVSDVALFQIGGVRIATASAFLRFLFPTQYGIVDSRLAGQVTNPASATAFNLRPNDNYITDTNPNRAEYNNTYVPLLQAEANWLNNAAVTFNDPDPMAIGPQHWRPCDVEMALW